MNTSRRSIQFMVAASFAGLLLAGCSDKSRMLLQIESILTSGSGNLFAGLPYLEVDMMGNTSLSHCSVVQDTVIVTCNLESPGVFSNPTVANRGLTTGTFGPTVSGVITGYRLEYFYFDPNDGALHGPVSGLTVDLKNIHRKLFANAPAVQFVIPV